MNDPTKRSNVFGPRRAVVLALALGATACADLPPTTTQDPVLNAQGIAAEVQRVFNDAACYCESYELLPQPAGTSSTDVLISASQAAGDPLLTAYVNDPQYVGRTQCWWLGPNSARGSLSTRRYDAADLQRFACSGPGDASTRPYARPYCHSEFDACLARELELAADSTAHPLDPSVRDAVRAESLRRLQAATALAMSTQRTTISTPPVTDDSRRQQGDYGTSIYVTRTPDAVSTFATMSDRMIDTALRQADAITPGMAEETSFGALAFGPTSSRARLLTTFYGSATIASAPAPLPAPTPATITATPATSAYVGASLPTVLMANNFATQMAAIQVYRESENVVLASQLDLRSSGGVLVPSTTHVNVYLVHYDPNTTLATQALAVMETRLDFGRRILGLQTTALGTAPTFDRSGTTYPAAAGREIEPGQDTVVFSRRAVYAYLAENSGVDEFRVITTAEPDVAPTVVSAERSGDMPYASRVYGEVDAPRTVALLAQYRIALPHTSCSAATGEVTQASWAAQPRTSAQTTFDALETAVRTALHRTVPRPADEAYVLTESYGLGVADIGDAFDYLRDADALLDGVVLAPPDGAPCPAPSIVRSFVPRTRSIVPLQAAFARTGTGTLTYPAYPTTGMVPGWYDVSPAQTSAIGAVGTLQQVRYATATTNTAYPGQPATYTYRVETLAAIDALIGPSWSEWRVCEGSPACDGDAAGTGRWSVFEAGATFRSSTSRFAVGAPVMVTTAADARCLLAGHEPLNPAGNCAHVTSDPSRFVALAALAPSGSTANCGTASDFGSGAYCRRSFTLPGMASAAPDARRYVLWRWRLPTDPSSMPDQF